MRAWTDDMVNELADFIADGPDDATAFARAALALDMPEEACRNRFTALAQDLERMKAMRVAMGRTD